jgi:hypothetical protein
MRLALPLIVIGLIVLIAPPCLLADQTTVTLAGIVEDDSGGAIPGAVVTLADQNTVGRFDAISRQDGTFTIEGVTPATYVLKVALSGFETYQKVVTVGVTDLKPLKVALRVARVKQDVTVVADVLDELSTSGTTAGTAKLDDDLILALPIASDDVFTMIGRFVSPLGVGIDGGSIVVDGVQGGYIDMPSSAIASLRVNRNPYSTAFQYPGNSRIEIATKRAARVFRRRGPPLW